MKLIITHHIDLNRKNIHNAILFFVDSFKSKNKFIFYFIKSGKIHNEKFPQNTIN